MEKAKHERRDDSTKPLDSRESTDSPRKKIPDLAQLVSLALLTILGVGTGAWLYPGSDTDPVLPGRFMLTAPSTVEDKRGPANITMLSWTELHTADGSNPNGIPVPPGFIDQPLTPGATVRAEVNVVLDRILENDVPFSIEVDLPPGAKLASCIPPKGRTAQCQPHDPQQNLILAQNMSAVAVTGTIKATDPQRPFHSGYSFYLDVSGVNGIGFATTRTRAKVQIPMVLLSAVPGTANPPYTLTSAALLPDALAVTWSDRPSFTGGNVSSLVGWNIRYPTHHWAQFQWPAYATAWCEVTPTPHSGPVSPSALRAAPL